MRLLAIVPNLYDTSPGQRFRLEQWEPSLRARGVEIDWQPFECPELKALLHQPGQIARKMRLIAQALGRRLRLLTRVRQYDAVYIFREAAVLGPALIERLVSRAGLPVIFDFDDAIFVRYVSPSNGYLSYLKFPGKTDSICRLSAQVLAGNQYLHDYARQFNQNVSIVPTTIDTLKYQVVPKLVTPDSVPVIGWSGSYSTVQYFDTLRSALQRLAQHERFKVRVIGTPNYELPGVEVEALPWRAATEVQDLSALDIGVMPLLDDPWSSGKCGLKALQYMALGIPAICSPVGVNATIIRDGVNGFLAMTEAEWIERLTRLLRSAELRWQLGMAGRATVEQQYAAEIVAPQVYQLLQAAVAGRHKIPAETPSFQER